ncbi:MAG: hypothetical protein VKJ02_03030, partial [Snowella sp.]|nr:hypothetical protein [Snowella sp.]
SFPRHPYSMGQIFSILLGLYSDCCLFDHRPQTSHIFRIGSKWYRCYFYICGTYNCPSPRAIAPSFEAKFTRLEYVAPDKFNLAYFRHTGQWWEVDRDLTLEQALTEIKTNLIYHPH